MKTKPFPLTCGFSVQLRDLERILALLESGVPRGIEVAAIAIERIIPPVSSTGSGPAENIRGEPQANDVDVEDMVFRAAALLDPDERSETKAAAAVKLLYLMPYSEVQV